VYHVYQWHGTLVLAHLNLLESGTVIADMTPTVVYSCTLMTNTVHSLLYNNSVNETIVLRSSHCNKKKAKCIETSLFIHFYNICFNFVFG